MSVFFSKNDTTLGLDIGSRLVKLVQLKHTGKGMELLNIGFDIVPPETIVDGTVMDFDPVIKVIQKLLKQFDIKTLNVNTSVSGKAVIVKKVKLPYVNEKELKESIKWEAEQYIPFDMEDVNLDSQILSQNIEKKETDLILVAVKKDKINNHLNLIKTAGLNPVIIDIDAFAVQNAYEASSILEPEKVIALINIGCSITNINIIINGIPFFTRDITMGGNNITKALQKDLLLNFDEAEQIKINYSENFSNKEQSTPINNAVDEDVKGIIENIMNELSLEISHSFDYYHSFPENKKVDAVVLSGGTAKLPNIDSFLSKKLNLPVEIQNPFKNIILNEKKFDSKYIQSIAPIFTVGMGLALRQED